MTLLRCFLLLIDKDFDMIEDKYLNDIDGINGDSEFDFAIPEAEYNVAGNISFHDYVGETVPIPLSLCMYLRNNELKVMALFIYHYKRFGNCYVSAKRIGEILNLSPYCINKTIKKFSRMGLLKNAMSVRKELIFNSIKTLDEIGQNRKPGAISALRFVLGDDDIRKVTPTNLARIRNYEFLDECELEEYNNT